MKYKVILIILFFARTFSGYAQTATGTELQELVKIAEVYNNISSLSFNMYYTYADSLTWQTIVDTAFIDCKLSYGKSFLSNSEMEMLLGREYIVYVDKTDSSIMTAPVNDPKSIFQIPLLDSIFRKAHVTSMTSYSVNSSTRILFVNFKPESYFLTYKIAYDPNTGLIDNVNFHVRNESGAHDIPADHIICATVYMQNYSDAPLDPAIFNEYRYFYKLNGNLFLQQAWAQYHLQN